MFGTWFPSHVDEESVMDARYKVDKRSEVGDRDGVRDAFGSRHVPYIYKMLMLPRHHCMIRMCCVQPVFGWIELS